MIGRVDANSGKPNLLDADEHEEHPRSGEH